MWQFSAVIVLLIASIRLYDICYLLFVHRFNIFIFYFFSDSIFRLFLNIELFSIIIYVLLSLLL